MIVLDFLAGVVLFAFALLGLIVPLVAIFQSGIVSHFPLFDVDVLHAAKLTAVQASLSAIISLILGTLLGFFVHHVGRSRAHSLRGLRTILALPFGVPAVVASSAWVAVAGKSGLHLGFLYSLTAVVIAHVFFNVPWVALWTSRAFDEVSRSQREASRTLGANAWNEFWYLLIPEIFPTLVSVFSQVFAFCAMSFILVLILGGGPPVETLETALYIKVRSGGLDLSGASACAFWQLLLTVIPWVVLNRLRSAPTGMKKIALFNRPSTAEPVNFFQVGLSFMIVLTFLSPYLYIARFSAIAHFFELMGRTHARYSILIALVNSLQISIPTALLSLSIGVSGIWLDHRFRFRKRLAGLISTLMILPSGISTMVLGLGIFVAYRNWIDPFSSSLFPVIFLQSVFFVAVVFRILKPVALRFQKNELEAARTLGAGVWKSFFEIEFHRWRMPLLASFSLIFGAALGEVGAVSLFYNESRVPLALLLARWTSQYRFEDAQSVAIVLMFMSLAFIAWGVSYERT